MKVTYVSPFFLVLLLYFLISPVFSEDLDGLRFDVFTHCTSVAQLSGSSQIVDDAYMHQNNADWMLQHMKEINNWKDNYLSVKKKSLSSGCRGMVYGTGRYNIIPPDINFMDDTFKCWDLHNDDNYVKLYGKKTTRFCVNNAYMYTFSDDIDGANEIQNRVSKIINYDFQGALKENQNRKDKCGEDDNIVSKKDDYFELYKNNVGSFNEDLLGARHYIQKYRPYFENKHYIRFYNGKYDFVGGTSYGNEKSCHVVGRGFPYDNVDDGSCQPWEGSTCQDPTYIVNKFLKVSNPIVEKYAFYYFLVSKTQELSKLPDDVLVEQSNLVKKNNQHAEMEHAETLKLNEEKKEHRKMCVKEFSMPVYNWITLMDTSFFLVDGRDMMAHWTQEDIDERVDRWSKNHSASVIKMYEDYANRAVVAKGHECMVTISASDGTVYPFSPDTDYTLESLLSWGRQHDPSFVPASSRKPKTKKSWWSIF